MVDSEMVDTALLKVESFESWTSAPPQMLEDLSNLGFGFYQPRRVEVVAADDAVLLRVSVSNDGEEAVAWYLGTPTRG